MATLFAPTPLPHPRWVPQFYVTCLCLGSLDWISHLHHHLPTGCLGYHTRCHARLPTAWFTCTPPHHHAPLPHRTLPPTRCLQFFPCLPALLPTGFTYLLGPALLLPYHPLPAVHATLPCTFSLGLPHPTLLVLHTLLPAPFGLRTRAAHHTCYTTTTLPHTTHGAWVHTPAVDSRSATCVPHTVDGYHTPTHCHLFCHTHLPEFCSTTPYHLPSSLLLIQFCLLSTSTFTPTPYPEHGGGTIYAFSSNILFYLYNRLACILSPATVLLCPSLPVLSPCTGGIL